MCDGKELSKVEFTKEEETEIQELIRIGNESLNTFYQVVQRVKEKKYYRIHGTFKEFCVKEWGKSYDSIRRHLVHEQTVKALTEESKKLPMGNRISEVVENVSERATRELGGLTTADKLETIKKASENGKKTPTAKEIKEARTMDEPTEDNSVETNTIEVDREELARLKNIEAEYENLKSQKPIKTCPHCRKDTSKQPVKTTHTPQQFDRTQEKRELSEYFA